MRRAAKIDRNQPEIVAALRAMNAKVYPMHMVGGGFPDLLVCYEGMTLLMEVKDGSRPPSERQLTPDQREFHGSWVGGPLSIVTDVEGALRALKVWRASNYSTQSKEQ